MFDKPTVKVTIGCMLAILSAGRAQTISSRAKDTPTAVEMNHGEMLQFQLESGRVFHLVLEDKEAANKEKII